MIIDELNKKIADIESLANDKTSTIESKVSDLTDGLLMVADAVDIIPEMVDEKITAITKEFTTIKDAVKKVKAQKGDNGIDGLDGRDGKDGENGKDGSPDTPEQVAEKLNKLENAVDSKVIKGFDGFLTKPDLDRAISILDQRTQYLINRGAAVTSGGSLSIGSSITGGTPTEVLYADNSGNLFSDSLMTRDSTTTQTAIKTNLGVVPSATTDFLVGLESGSLLGGAAFGGGVTITDPNDATKYGFNVLTAGAGDTLGISNGIFDLTNGNYVNIMGGLDDGSGNSFYLIELVNTTNGYSAGFQLNEINASLSHSELVQLISPTEIIVRTDPSATDWWSLPLTRGAGAGYVLTDLLGNGVTSWEPSAGGGGTPGGSDTMVQFNDGGTFNGDSGLLFQKGTKSFFVGDNASLRGISNTIDNAGFAQVWTSVKSLRTAISFTGAGLDDLVQSGDYNGSVFPTTYTITVAANGTPDTFDWSDSNGGSGTGVAMSTSPIFLSDNVYISFGADTGHAIGDNWEFTYNLTNTVWGIYDSPTNQLGWGDIGNVLFGNSITMDLDNGFIGIDSRASISIGDVDGTGNTTKIIVNDLTQLITVTNVPTYADDTAATGAGLTTGQLYKTTTGGITALNIVP